MTTEAEARQAALRTLKEITEDKTLPSDERGRAAVSILESTCGCPCHFADEEERVAGEEARPS